MSGKHFLIVPADPADGMEVEHPDDCPTETVYDGRVVVFTCGVGFVEYEAGVGHYFSCTADDPCTVYTPPGRHEIEYWTECVYGEFDYGLALVEGGAS